MKTCRNIRAARGFSLVEVMVAVIIIAVGMLGIAKIQALALSSTGVASARSLAAIEASSLAAAMSANRGYWAAGLAPNTPILINGTTISNAALASAVNCAVVGSPCLPATMAAYDVQQWVIALNQLLRAPQANITCVSNPGKPVSCSITINWAENLGAANSNGAPIPGVVGMVGPTYTLLTQP